jgi:hypothetical protein
MNYDFDFNINNYNVDELESFLKLNENYTFNDINDRCSRMNSIINENKEYDKVYKTNLGVFLDDTKIKLVKHIKKISREDDGFIEDYDKLISKDQERVINQTSVTHAGSSYVINPETITFNDIIDKTKHLEPVETYPTNISRSNLNNLKRKTIMQTVVLNTLFREDYFGTTSTDFSIVLPYYFKNVLSLRLSSLQLPNVIYCISKSNGNNTFYIEEETTGISGTITFPDGNYIDINDFCTLLQSEINTQLGIAPDRFIVTYDINSTKITISNNTYNFVLIFNTRIQTVYLKCKTKITPKTKENIKNSSNFGEKYINFVPTEGQREQNCVNLEEIYKKFGWLVGYRDEVYSGSNSYTTEGVYNGAYPNYIYFVLNDFNNSQAQTVFGMYSKSIIGDNILGMIPITSQSFYVNFTNGNDFIERKREYFGPVRIQRLKVQLLNQYGNVINLNNMDYSFSLEFEIGYDI